MNKKITIILSVVFVFVALLGITLSVKADSTLIDKIANVAGTVLGNRLFEQVSEEKIFGGSEDGDSNVINLVASGDLTAGDDLTVGDDAYVAGRLTERMFALASSSGAANGVLTEAQLLAYGQFDYTLTNAANTLTLPATSTMTTFIPNSGDSATFLIRNLSLTDASSTTITEGAGTEIQEGANGDEVLGGNQNALLKFVREADTDVTVYLTEFIKRD